MAAHPDDVSSSSSYVIVVRHGEREDYRYRDDLKQNWMTLSKTATPYDPPLSSRGLEQAHMLGQHLARDILPTLAEGAPLKAIYTSPFIRCRQTACQARKGIVSILQQKQQQQQDTDTKTASKIPLVGVEWGLAESLNENWYRSWALPGADGTWGYKINGQRDYDKEMLHPAAKVPVQESVLATLEHDWKNNNNNNDHDNMNEHFNVHHSSQTRITEPYCFYTNTTESRSKQQKRMLQVLETLSSSTANNNSSQQEPQQQAQTIMLVSHGGPVTHLYEGLTGNPWHVHGESTYCCYSIYKQTKKNDGGSGWEPIYVNENKFLQQDNKEATKRSDNYMDE